MEQFSSALLTSFFANDPLVSPSYEHLYFKKNLLGGFSLGNGNGNTMIETIPNATGGETVTFSTGETAHLSENIYGGQTLDFPGVQNDIVGRPSIFGESYYQNGESIGSSQPNFMGNGTDFYSSSGETITVSESLFAGTQQVIFSSPIVEPVTHSINSFSSFNSIDTISSQISVADLGSATDVLDGVDFLGLL